VAKRSSAVPETVRGLMAKHGLTTAEIHVHVETRRRGPEVGAKAAVKAATSAARYQDPRTGATWSGHARAPRWTAGAKYRDKFLGGATTVTAKPASATTAKAAGLMSAVRSRRFIVAPNLQQFGPSRSRPDKPGSRPRLSWES
jgi:hypothetical protein